jgi:hypothetical protein
MDDPLIGLTIYHTKSKALTVEDNDTGKIVRKSRHDDSENCFPCLPSIPDDQEQMAGRLKPADRTKENGERGEPETGECSMDNESQELQHVTSPNNFWLMRLFQSSLFDMSIAIGYLFNSKDPDVQHYLGSRLFVSLHLNLLQQLAACDNCCTKFLECQSV